IDVIMNRRSVLCLLGATAFAGAPIVEAAGSEIRIGQLIEEARGKGAISQRIDFISGALRGTPYLGYTLIGGPTRPEKFVVRDDAFDCVTFCETVLAAAIASNRSQFDSVLRNVRYHNGAVAWRERNHYFFVWCQHNVENNMCRLVDLGGAVDINKTVDSEPGLGRRQFTMTVIPSASFLANSGKLERGDVIGFVSRRPNLDYFHTGFVVFDKTGVLLLRHASQSRRRVLDERIDAFVSAIGGRYVPLVRPQESCPAALKYNSGGRGFRLHFGCVGIHQRFGDPTRIEIPVSDLRHGGHFRCRTGDEALGKFRQLVGHDPALDHLKPTL